MIWLTITLSIFMGGTGLILESEIEGEREWLLSKLDLEFVRQLHGSTGKWLVLALAVMTATGLVMWGYPLLVKKINQSNNQNKGEI